MADNGTAEMRAARLLEIEAAIDREEHDEAAFVKVGKLITEIHDGKLYKATHRTFEAYCRERWGWSRAHAYRLMKAAKVAEEMSPVGDIPVNERQARKKAAGHHTTPNSKPQKHNVRLLYLAIEDVKKAQRRVEQTRMQTRIPEAAAVVARLKTIAKDLDKLASEEERRAPTMGDIIRDAAMEQADISKGLAERRLAEKAHLNPRDVAGRRRKESLAREHRTVAAAAESVLAELDAFEPVAASAAK